MYSHKDVKRSTLTVAVLLALGVGTVYGSVGSPGTTGNNFTMISSAGGLQGGNNDTVFTWDGTLKTTVVTDGTNNATLSSASKFSGFLWTAHHINVYGTGTYVFDTSCASGNPSCGTGTAAQKYTLVVPAGYLGVHMLFNWNTSSNIDVVQLWKINDSWAATGKTAVDSDPIGSATSSDPFCGELTAPATPTSCQTGVNNGNTRTKAWSLVSVDSPSSTIDAGAAPTDETNISHGTKMIDGPFIGSQANFNVMMDTTPDVFTFTDQTGVATSSTIQSAAITISKTGGGTFTISVTNGEYSLDGGTTYQSTSGIVSTGQTVRARHTSAATTGTNTDTTVTIGGVSDIFSSTTAGAFVADTTPNAFTFSDQDGVTTSTVITSNTISVAGINTATTISITGGEYSINGGAYASAGSTVSNGNTVTVHHTSSSAGSTATNTTLTIGGVSDTFSSTTAAASTAVTEASAPSNMPGCSISSKPDSAIERGDWWLVAGFLAWLGALRMRFKRQAQS